MGAQRPRGFAGALLAAGAAAVLLALTAPAARAALSAEEMVDPAGSRHQMVTTPQGEVVLAWERQVSDPDAPFGYRTELWVAVKPPGGALGAPIRIHIDIYSCTLQLEVDEDGNVALAFEADGDVFTALKPAGQAFQDLLPVTEPANNGGAGFQLDVADGDVAIGWVHFHFGNAFKTVYGATVSKGGAPFGQYRTLAEYPYTSDGTAGFDISLAPNGELTSVWARRDGSGGPWLIQTTYLTAAGILSQVQTLVSSVLPKSCPKVDGDAQGRVAVLWMESGCDEDSLHIATRVPGAAFGAPVKIASSGFIWRVELDVAPDGTIRVGYSDSVGVINVLSGLFDGPIVRVPGTQMSFNDVTAASQPATVLASNEGISVNVSDVAADGSLEPGPWLEAAGGEAKVGPLGNEGVAVAYHNGNGIALRTGSLEPTPPPAPPSAGVTPQDTGPPILLWDDGKPTLPLGRQLARAVGCNLACTVTGTGELLVKSRSKTKRFGLEKTSVRAPAFTPVTLNLAVPRAGRKAAMRAIRRGRSVIAHLTLRADSTGEGMFRKRDLQELTVRVGPPARN